MQERQVTIEGETHPLEPPFLVIATQNPIEYEGTYPLPEAQLDRFLLRIRVGYPDAGRRVGAARAADRARRRTRSSSSRSSTATALLELQQAIEQVHVAEPIGRYIVDVVARDARERARRRSARARAARSRCSSSSRCRAALAGRDFVTPDDVKAVAVPALAHRLMLKPELWVQRVQPEDVVARGARRRCRRRRPRTSPHAR